MMPMDISTDRSIEKGMLRLFFQLKFTKTR